MPGDKAKTLSSDETEATGLKSYLMKELAVNFANELKVEQDISDHVRRTLTSYLGEEYPDPQIILNILCRLEEPIGRKDDLP